MSKSFKHFFDLLVGEVKRNVFHVNVIDELSALSTILGLKFQGNGFVLILAEFDSLGCRYLVMEANESIPSGRMVWVERDLERFDFTDLLKFLLEVAVLEIFWDLADEHIVGHELLPVITTKQLPVKLKSSALLPIEFEIFHSLNRFGEGLRILDADNGRVEWLCDVFSDLRLSLKNHIGQLFESNCDFP